MLETFGATFFGVITSFLLWYFGQWLIMRQRNQTAVKHMLRETNEEIDTNINILHLLVQDTPKMLAEGNIPVYMSSRMQLSVYTYLIASGELRLLNAHKRNTIASAGMIADSFNKFIENSELVLVAALGLPQPQSLVVAKHRLNGLTEQAKDTAKALNKILEDLGGVATKT